MEITRESSRLFVWIHRVNQNVYNRSTQIFCVIFYNKMSFKNHINMIAEKADICSRAIISKNREWKSFQPRVFLYLFDHLISPVLSYGFEIWGNKEWEEIEKIASFYL